MDLNLYAKFPQDIIQAATAYTQHIAGIGNLNTTTAKRVGSLIISATRVQNVGHKSMGISFFERIKMLVSKMYAIPHQMLLVMKC